jgi:hypothetical protein
MNLGLRGEEVGREEGKTLGQRRGLKKPWAEEDKNKNALLGCAWVHPQNGLNGLILNWCTGGCWFTLASDDGKGWLWGAGNGNRMKFNGEVSPVVEIVAQFAWAFNSGLLSR